MNGFHLRWSRISKSVQVKEVSPGLLRGSISASSKSKGPVVKNILDDVSGSANPGEILAIMGPSGSGKTSLLNVLAGRSSYDEGVLSVNGEELSGQSRKKLMSKIAYVKQNDIFFEQLTVRDQLTYTALLRLPSSSFTKEEKLAEVEKTLSFLRLGKVADSPIMLCSGGEKKRVNIGTEMLTDPVVLLLDEPTSGLDSTSAFTLIKTLQSLCRSEGKTIITSIHQPNSAVFCSFDKLLMMAEGNVVYFGTPSHSLTYLNELNFKIPEGYNAPDHWMDLLVKDNLIESSEEEESKREDLETTELVSEDSNEAKVPERSLRHRRKSSVSDIGKARGILIDTWDGEVIAKQLDTEIEEVQEDERSVDTQVLDDVKKYNNTWLTQFHVLIHRSLKNTRSAIFTPVNLIKSVAIGLIAGLLWFQIERTENTVRDVSSFFFFTMTYWVFDSMFNALSAFPSERTVILKERASASYRLSAYFLAKTMSEAPTRLVLPFLYMLTSFWMTGISDSFGVFVATTGVTLLCVFAGEALGLMFGALCYDLQKALTVMTVVGLATMLLGGFFVTNIPAFLAWGKYLSPFKYAFDAAQAIVFNENIPCDGSGVLEDICGGSDEGHATPNQIQDFLGVQGTIPFNVGMLITLSLIPRYVAYVALRMKKSGERD
eukprot:CAMPEP_0178908188 /NCGR_PEP_ID=MMETSP0786-20121207/7785_1 /TAXON_ID=186022 /ORGANISM="Thalassionema frauenfeldii, Strain CCMP 1798" /LENGTH=657 /DNA_ID=CAMNT_0020580065 /DNA_START=116 /DNA_END=2089 /DNA_ORIENTATION=-